MPRYFFDVSDSKGFHRDEFGDDLADFDEARTQCLALLPDIVREEFQNSELHMVTCHVRDEHGRTVYKGKLTLEGAPEFV